MTKTAYEKLSVHDSARVNDVILKMIMNADADQLNAFRKAVRDHSPEIPVDPRNQYAPGRDYTKGFQTVLDAMRNTLAANMKAVPEIQDDGQVLGKQRQLLREIKDVIKSEYGRYDALVRQGSTQGTFNTPDYFKGAIERKGIAGPAGADVPTEGLSGLLERTKPNLPPLNIEDLLRQGALGTDGRIQLAGNDKRKKVTKPDEPVLPPWVGFPNRPEGLEHTAMIEPAALPHIKGATPAKDGGRGNA